MHFSSCIWLYKSCSYSSMDFVSKSCSMYLLLSILTKSYESSPIHLIVFFVSYASRCISFWIIVFASYHIILCISLHTSDSTHFILFILFYASFNIYLIIHFSSMHLIIYIWFYKSYNFMLPIPNINFYTSVTKHCVLFYTF